MTALPPIIQLAYRSIPVSYEALEDLHGDSTEAPPAIRVNSDFTPDLQAETLLHETLHHVSWMYGLGWTEKTVRLMEVIFTSLVRDNPDLFLSLIEAPSEKAANDSTPPDPDPDLPDPWRTRLGLPPVDRG